MSHLDDAELGDDTLSSDELVYLQNLTHSSGRVRFGKEFFLVSLDDSPAYSIFCSTNMASARGSTFMCNKTDGKITQMENCDISWVKAFLNGYKEIEY